MFSSSPEPMVMGSPGQSPVGFQQRLPLIRQGLLNATHESPHVAVAGVPASSYAPAFLLGNNAVSPIGGGTRRTHRTSSFRTYSKPERFMATDPGSLAKTPTISSKFSGGGQPKVTWSPDLVQEIPQAKRGTSTRGTAIGSALGGPPPLKTLAQHGSDTSTSQAPVSANHTNLNARSMTFDETYDVISAASILDESRRSPSQMDPFYTQGEHFNTEDIDPRCVTVFGFTPEQASFVLQHFAQYGTVVAHEKANKGNWMHLRYLSPLEAKKALSKNGKIFDGCLQLGVQPCVDKSILSRGNTDRTAVKRSAAAPVNRIFSPVLSSLNDSRRPILSSSDSDGPTAEPPASVDVWNQSYSTDRPGMRSLTAAYKAANSSFSVTGNDHGTPQKANDSVLGKALTYMFGT